MRPFRNIHFNNNNSKIEERWVKSRRWLLLQDQSHL